MDPRVREFVFDWNHTWRNDMLVQRWTTAAVYVITVSVLWGCGLDADDKRSCRDDSDCLDGWSCVDGTCETSESSPEEEGEDAGRQNLSQGSDCECAGPDERCCDDGLFCHAEEACNVTTNSGCKTVGTCIPKREYGESCDAPYQCENEDARCLSDSGCQPPPLGEERCETNRDCSPGRICDQSYCLLKRGEECTSNDDCASGNCYQAGGFRDVVSECR